MKLPYDLSSFGIAEALPMAVTALQEEPRRVEILDDFSYIAVFLDCPEANHVYCVGRDYIDRVYRRAVLALAWNHGLPIHVHRRIPPEEWDAYTAEMDRRTRPED
ncbi:hypothetical protein KIH31_03635 [Paenarthrobacter sp. DKR-5]|uniref:hypothetical protein n=1 Tax=Paenarthrobacter sp. DKR-5 TaxID=2835535 RepID=UPI001BDBCFE1|nr:hypothetical protein [Paenarthrobacter sp. DKR-5]MBT1001684.1 hypothetical protein [Paenarthrobacter sp. DKR-5]